ncbi:MAG: hypothetical protein C0430_09215 [Flavobacterium sp.]|nr:hypothetical protein [Flavobacterium sp.]
MTAASSDSKRSSSANKSDVSDMVKYPLRGKTNSETNENGNTTNAGKGTVTNNTSSTQDELRKGKVQ